MSDAVIDIQQMTDSVGDALLVVALEGFEGPIDLLLHLAKDQKVDLARLSMVRLADQYLAYIHRAGDLKLEVAADYLVMAAWLAYLKSRLLLPKQEAAAEDEPSGEDLAAALAWQLRRLEAMQKAALNLFALPRLGYDVFFHGQSEGLITITHAKAMADIYDLMSAYAEVKNRTEKPAAMKMMAMELFSIEEAVGRLRAAIALVPEWTDLSAFMPKGQHKGILKRSAIAATFIATLELAKQGLLEVKQEQRYGAILLRRHPDFIYGDAS